MSVIWRVRRAGVVHSNGDARYRVERVCHWASKAASGSMDVWMLWTSRSDVFALDMQGGEYVRSCEQDMSQKWRGVTSSISHGSHRHGIRVVSCLECLET